MKPSQLTSALELLISAKQPCFIWGPPGIGKSQVVAQTANRLGLDLIDIRAVLLDPVDLRGLPHVNGDGRAHWCTPEFLPHDPKTKGVLFLDELNRAPQLVQNACLQLVLDRRIGEYILPERWVVLAAGNDEGVGVNRMDSALRSRFQHLTAEVDLEDWSRWAVQNDIQPMVIAFLRSFPHLLHAYDKSQRAFPCPRTWEFISRITALKPAIDLQQELYAGAIGDGPAVEYCAYARMYSQLPSIDAILLNPDTAPVPKKSEPSACFAVSAALARRTTDKTIGRVHKYMARMEEEYGVYAMKDAITRDSSLQTTKEFTKWAIAHQEVIF